MFKNEACQETCLKVHFYGQSLFFNENEYVCCITLITWLTLC